MSAEPTSPSDSRSQIIALFDFDGTVTYCDSLMPFLRFTVGQARFWMGMICLAPVLLRYGLGRMDREKLKEIVLEHYIGGWDASRLHETATRFATSNLASLCKEDAIARIWWHQEQGHRIILISASPDAYLSLWAADLPIETVLATRLEIRDGMVSGRIDGRNCRGAEKITRLSEYLGDLHGYEYYGYGDSDGDRELLALADHSFYKPFRQKGAGLTSRLRFIKALF